MKTVVIFIKAPIPGKVKTRLCPPLSAAQAAALYKAFARDTVALVQRSAEVGEMEIAYAAEKPFGNIRWLNTAPETKFFIQRGKNLGARLIHAFDRAFRSGASEVVVLGSDTPHLNPREIRRAFEILKRKDVVVGPARDGGYYLIGLRKPNPRLFKGIPWSSYKVLTATMNRISKYKLSYALLPPYEDVDTYHDLLQFILRMVRGSLKTSAETRKIIAKFCHGFNPTPGPH